MKKIAFTPKYLCESALYSIIRKWLPNFYSDKLTGLLFIDISKAIGTFNQHVLLHKHYRLAYKKIHLTCLYIF